MAPCPYYYELSEVLSTTLQEPDERRGLPHHALATFKDRYVMILDKAFHEFNTDKSVWTRTLAIAEQKLFEQGNSGVYDFNTWKAGHQGIAGIIKQSKSANIATYMNFSKKRKERGEED